MDPLILWTEMRYLLPILLAQEMVMKHTVTKYDIDSKSYHIFASLKNYHSPKFSLVTFFH